MADVGEDFELGRLSRWTNVSTEWEAVQLEAQGQRKWEAVTTEAEVWEERRRDATGLGGRKGSRTKECKQPLEAEQAGDGCSPEGTSPADTF